MGATRAPRVDRQNKWLFEPCTMNGIKRMGQLEDQRRERIYHVLVAQTVALIHSPFLPVSTDLKLYILDLMIS